jgi:hypothetical protein
MIGVGIGMGMLLTVRLFRLLLPFKLVRGHPRRHLCFPPSPSQSCSLLRSDQIMPPAPLLHQIFPRRQFDANAPTAAFANEWSNPSNYAFTILLLLGGDVITRALAQLAGGIVTPVAFSFGTLFAIYRLSAFYHSLLAFCCFCSQRSRMGVLRHLSHLHCRWRK